MTSRARDGRVACGLATVAVACAAAFTVWALTASAYSSGETILEANAEASTRVAIAIPVVVASVVWLLLHIACRFEVRRARTAALALAWLLVALAVVTGFTIGMFVMPAAAALVAAAVRTPVAAS